MDYAKNNIEMCMRNAETFSRFAFAEASNKGDKSYIIGCAEACEESLNGAETFKQYYNGGE